MHPILFFFIGLLIGIIIGVLMYKFKRSLPNYIAPIPLEIPPPPDPVPECDEVSHSDEDSVDDDDMPTLDAPIELSATDTIPVLEEIETSGNIDEIVQKPVEIAQKPVEIVQKPVEIAQKPVEIAQKPVEIVQKPKLKLKQ